MTTARYANLPKMKRALLRVRLDQNKSPRHQNGTLSSIRSLGWAGFWSILGGEIAASEAYTRRSPSSGGGPAPVPGLGQPAPDYYSSGDLASPAARKRLPPFPVGQTLVLGDGSSWTAASAGGRDLDKVLAARPRFQG